MHTQLRTRSTPLCCRIVGSPVESDRTIAAAFFDLDKTIISRSSTLAFGPSFYKHGLISRGDAVRTAFAQLVFRVAGADPHRMERVRAKVGPIGDRLGASEVIATRMEVAGGCYTGEMEFWAYGEAKAHRMRELAASRGYRLRECYAYSDSITDLPMLETVGHPRAVNPDRALRRVAKERQWPILAFSATSPAAADHRTPTLPAGASVRRRHLPTDASIR